IGAALQWILKCSSLVQFHDDAASSGGFSEAINLCNVRMIQGGEDVRFTLKAIQTVRIGRKRRRQNFKRNVTTEPGIMCAIDLAHSARSDSRQNFIVFNSCS